MKIVVTALAIVGGLSIASLVMDIDPVPHINSTAEFTKKSVSTAQEALNGKMAKDIKDVVRKK